MPDEIIKIQVTGLKELQAAIAKFPRQSAIYLGKAGGEAANRVILPTRGLQKYPPMTDANRPPEPYYIRGRGVMTKKGLRGVSENLGKQWYVKRDLPAHTTEIGNRSSYAKWVHSEEQARAMGRIGWKKLLEVTQAKIGNITKVYDAWIKKLLRDIGL